MHLAFVGFVVLGGFAVPRRPRLAWLHLPAVAWGVGIELTGAICPLTPLEHWLRWEAGATGYDGDFIARYLLPVLYPAGLSRRAQIVLGDRRLRNQRGRLRMVASHAAVRPAAAATTGAEDRTDRIDGME